LEVYDEEKGPEPKAAQDARAKFKKELPLYIGLATGFCGSFTSFSSFMRDVFFALENGLPSPVNHSFPQDIAVTTDSTVPRNGGYSFMAVCAVVILTVTVCYGALKVGAHIAIFLDPISPTLSPNFLDKILNRAAVVLGIGAWLGAIFMAIWPPDRPGGPVSKGSWTNETWRGQAVFACAFAPAGCLLRFYVSLKLNGLIPSFPLGTFFVNIFGTAVLGMAFDLQHLRLGDSGLVGGGRVPCQVLQGIMDGFCGSLTTVSTWILELNGLRRRHSYRYGAGSVLGGLAVLVAVMGSVRWSVGFREPVCVI
jgi:fluoride ion exporter CrcB/FEX